MHVRVRVRVWVGMVRAIAGNQYIQRRIIANSEKETDTTGRVP